MAQPGDTVVVHAGTYRERVDPARGGTATQPIVYRAADGEAVAMKGSEPVATWKQGTGMVWSVTLPSTFFGTFNPYATTVSGNYLVSGQWHHLGQVYLDDEALLEVQTEGELGSKPNTWYTTQSNGQTVISANFGGKDPNAALAEITVRPTVFFPSKGGLVSYVTLQGFTISQAATNWAPPDAMIQEGMIGSRGGSHWTVKNCTVRYSRNSGISFGNADGNSSERGHHLIEGNLIQRCGQAGVVGSRNPSYSHIVGNLIEDIDYLNEWFGWELGNIKVHNTADLVIEGNLLRQGKGHVPQGVWMDWANINTRFTRNIFVGFDSVFLLEEDHGPMLFDNNIFVGGSTQEYSARGTVGAHNLYVNVSDTSNEADMSRSPGVFAPHTTNQTSVQIVQENHDDQRFNNVYVTMGWSAPSAPGCKDDNNLYLAGAKKGASSTDTHGKVDPLDPKFAYVSDATGFSMSWDPGATLDSLTVPLLTSDTFGVFQPVGMRVENADGSTITIDHDFFGAARPSGNPRVGPFASGTKLTNQRLFDAKTVGAGALPSQVVGPDGGVVSRSDAGVGTGGAPGTSAADGGVPSSSGGSSNSAGAGGGAPGEGAAPDQGAAPDDGAGDGSSGGCSCRITPPHGSSLPLLGLVTLLGIRRRRMASRAVAPR
jgi:alpha-N-arabinofuranosidase